MTANTLDLRVSQKPKRRRHWGRALAITALVVVILAALTGGAWLAWRLWFQKPDLDSVKVVKTLIARHYILPPSEEPALATITDATKLQTPFLKHAKNGDKILIYQTAGVAIIYRPSLDRIVTVGPVNIQPTGSAK